jgi:aromatic-L-amino-acid decarboxylase
MLGVDDATRRTGVPRPADTLGLTEEEMRRLGRRVVDLVVDHFCGREAGPVIKTGDPGELSKLLGGELPEAPGDADSALDQLVEVALAHQQHGDHPRYFARVAGPSSFAAVLGEWLGVGFNSIATSWVGGSGPATVELVVLEWIRALLGLPLEGEGVLTSGGSMANMTALAAATASAGRGVAYLSDQTHASVARALRLLGYPETDIRTLPSDDSFRLSLATLARAVEDDERAGRSPRIVVGTAGTTNTGAVDPLAALADFCATRGLWFHVDGAYGAAAAACPESRDLFAGLERADSLVIDPHKWLFQPYDVGCTLVRKSGSLEQAFAMSPEYLRDTASHRGEPSFGNRSPELTRRSRALKLWMSFRTYGAARMRTAIQRAIELARYAEARILSDRRRFVLVTPAALGIVTFAAPGGNAELHERAATTVAKSGLAAVTTTTLHGVNALRFCILNPLTTEDDIDRTLEALAAACR